MAGLVTSLVAFVVNNGLSTLAEVQMLSGYLAPLSLFVVGAVSLVAFRFNEGPQTWEDVPVAMLVLGVVSLLGSFTDLITLEVAAMASQTSVTGMSTLASILLLLSYAYLGLAVTEKYVPFLDTK